MNKYLNENIEDIRKLKSTVFDLRLHYDAITDEKLRAEIKSVIQTGDKVYAELVSDNSKTPAANRFINSYMPTISKILRKYNNLVSKGIDSDESRELQASILETMPVISAALRRYYESMFKADINQADVDMEAMLRML